MSVLSRLAALPEIAKRNRIREEAGLPLLSIPKELRRMKKAEEEAEFEKIGRPIGGGLFH
jgi:hypothetical protein